EIKVRFVLIDREFKIIGIYRIGIKGHRVIIMINACAQYAIKAVVEIMLPVDVGIFIMILISRVAVQIKLIATDIPVYIDIILVVDLMVYMNGSIFKISTAFCIIFWQHLKQPVGISSSYTGNKSGFTVYDRSFQSYFAGKRPNTRRA